MTGFVEGHGFSRAAKPQIRFRPRRACPERSRRGPTLSSSLRIPL